MLFDVLDPKNAAAAQRNLLEPARRDGEGGLAVRPLYLVLDALEKLGQDDAVVKGDLPQLHAHDRRRGPPPCGRASPAARPAGGRFPTRSHCHAWSFGTELLPPLRIVLGIVPVEPAGLNGSRSALRPAGLSWARGTRRDRARASPRVVGAEGQDHERSLRSARGRLVVAGAMRASRASAWCSTGRRSQRPSGKCLLQPRRGVGQ